MQPPKRENRENEKTEKTRKRDNRFRGFVVSRFRAFTFNPGLFVFLRFRDFVLSCFRVFPFLRFRVFPFSRFCVFPFSRFRVFAFSSFSRFRVFAFSSFHVFVLYVQSWRFRIFVFFCECISACCAKPFSCCNQNVRVQSATEWTASVHTSHMPKAVITFVFQVLRNGLLQYILHTCPKL